MKSLWMLCVLVAGLGLAAGCGPQEAFCPETGKNGVCPIKGDLDAHVRQMDSGGPTSLCPAGQHISQNPDGNIIGICVPDNT